jgi:hypothetical protein
MTAAAYKRAVMPTDRRRMMSPPFARVVLVNKTSSEIHSTTRLQAAMTALRAIAI